MLTCKTWEMNAISDANTVLALPPTRWLVVVVVWFNESMCTFLCMWMQWRQIFEFNLTNSTGCDLAWRRLIFHMIQAMHSWLNLSMLWHQPKLLFLLLLSATSYTYNCYHSTAIIVVEDTLPGQISLLLLVKHHSYHCWHRAQLSSSSFLFLLPHSYLCGDPGCHMYSYHYQMLAVTDSTATATLLPPLLPLQPCCQLLLPAPW